MPCLKSVCAVFEVKKITPFQSQVVTHFSTRFLHLSMCRHWDFFSFKVFFVTLKIRWRRYKVHTTHYTPTTNINKESKQSKYSIIGLFNMKNWILWFFNPFLFQSRSKKKLLWHSETFIASIFSSFVCHLISFIYFWLKTKVINWKITISIQVIFPFAWINTAHGFHSILCYNQRNSILQAEDTNIWMWM